MTQEDKQLLLKDLCARLLYGIKFPYHMNGDSNHKECDCIATIDNISDDVVEFTYKEDGVPRDWSCPISEVKPYLRPMSSMDEMERGFFRLVSSHRTVPDGFGGDVEMYSLKCIDWLNANYFDYRGLIEKGLALEAPEGMYKND